MKASLSSSAPNLTLPEEILEQIISLALFPEGIGGSCTSETSAISLLLVCKAFDRIAKPLLYSSLHLRTREQSDKLAEILSVQPALGASIRTIRVDGPSASRALLVAAQTLTNSNGTVHRVLDLLDIRLVDERGLPSNTNVSQTKEDLERLNTALRACPDTKCLVMRQDGYLSCNTMISFVHALASGVSRWHSLEIVDLRMRPTPLPSPPGHPRPDPFAAALAQATNLRVLRARQPTLLNNFLLDIAKNPALERIELLDGTVGLPDPDSRLSPFLRLAFTSLDRRRYRFANLTPRRPQCAAPTCRRRLGDVGQDAEILEAATAELEAQLESEPQTLFASQIVAHPRLCALIRAGRLQLIIERLLMTRDERCLGGDSRKVPEPESGSGVHPCVCPGMDMGLPGPACNGCPTLRAGL